MKYVGIIYFLWKIPFFSFSQAVIDSTAIKLSKKYREAAHAAFMKKDWAGAIGSGKQLRSEAKKISDINGEVSGLNIAGVGYARSGNHPLAMMYFDSAVKISSGASDKSILEKIYANRGLEYDTVHQHKKAIDDYLLAEKYSTAIKDYEFLGMVDYSLLRAYYTFTDPKDPKKDPSKWRDVEYYLNKYNQLAKQHKEVRNRYLHYTY